MDVREKLVEILKQAPFEGKVLDEWWWEEKIKRIADHLISNGVTVQEWISVDEKLPQNFISVLGYMTNAQKIRAMSDEELADVVVNGVGCVLKAPHCMDVDCTPCILKWLKQPAE